MISVPDLTFSDAAFKNRGLKSYKKNYILRGNRVDGNTVGPPGCCAYPPVNLSK